MTKRNKRVLTDEQVKEGKRLRKEKGLTKAQLAELFGVGKTTIWENIFSTEKRVRIQHKINYRRNVCIPCKTCEICMTQIIKDNHIPVNLQVGDVCLSCYLKKIDVTFLQLLDLAHDEGFL